MSEGKQLHGALLTDEGSKVEASLSISSNVGLRCKNNHLVTQWRATEKFYRGHTGLRPKHCGLCGTRIHRKSPRWKCVYPWCSWYACQDCYDNFTLQAVTSPPKAEEKEIQIQTQTQTQTVTETEVKPSVHAAKTSTLLPVIAALAGQDIDDSDEELDLQEIDDDSAAHKSCIGCFRPCLPEWALNALGSSGSRPGKIAVYEPVSQSDTSTSIVARSSAASTAAPGDPSPHSDAETTTTELSPLADIFHLDTVDPVHDGADENIGKEAEKPRLRARPTLDLFQEIETSPSVGGIAVTAPHSDFLLPPEVVLYEPSDREIGRPCEAKGSRGHRMVFLNIELSQVEQEALGQLHKALENDKSIPHGTDGQIPLFVRLHALRILQQAKLDANKALDIMLTHVNLRVKRFPISDRDKQLMQDLRKGVMYWHGRDRQCHPCVIWRLERMEGLTKERALNLVLFVLEYGVRYALVPGRVETWVLIVDLEAVGLTHTSSKYREMGKICATILEQVYCGRNFQSKIFALPWMIRSVVNSFIPEDKKEKVQFVGDNERETVMRKLFEPHQLEKRYGGTAPNVEENEAYPYRFFPNCMGKASAAANTPNSLHTLTDRTFHEGLLWDESHSSTKEKWMSDVREQSLTPASAEYLKSIGIEGVKPVTDMTSWRETVYREER